MTGRWAQKKQEKTEKSILARHSPQKLKMREWQPSDDLTESCDHSGPKKPGELGPKRPGEIEPTSSMETAPEMAEWDPFWWRTALARKVPQEREAAEAAMEEVIRRLIKCPRGTMKDIQKSHMARAIKSRAKEKEIGSDRGAKFWGWLALVSSQNRVTLKLKTEWTNQWIGVREHAVNSLRADAAWTQDPEARSAISARADRAEMRGAIKTWMHLNEEPENGRGFVVLRIQKRMALRASRAHLLARMGGTDALNAALAIMALENEILVETSPGDKGWIERGLNWAEERGWLKPEKMDRWSFQPVENLVWIAEKNQRKMRVKYEPREGVGKYKVMDVGEGWGSIGIALASMEEGCEAIGVDRAGFLDQGEMHGTITSRVNLDLGSKGKRNILRRAAKLAGISLKKFLMIWLSPECRILTSANTMNVSSKCTNGKMLIDPRNKMSEGTKAMKMEELRQCNIAIGNQLQALEEENEVVLFALENPATSDLWKMKEVMDRLENEELGWTLITVDQCAYGRKCKKPTKILTNMRRWIPKGITGTGRCRILECAGTRNNQRGPGEGRHEQQIIATDPRRAPREGEKIEGSSRRAYSIRASKNLVAKDLIIEIVRAAIDEKESESNRAKRRKIMEKEEN